MPERPWEPEFIRLWDAGAKDHEIAAALGIPPGTANRGLDQRRCDTH
jgi:hypothetical protein